MRRLITTTLAAAMLIGVARRSRRRSHGDDTIADIAVANGNFGRDRAALSDSLFPLSLSSERSRRWRPLRR